MDLQHLLSFKNRLIDERNRLKQDIEGTDTARVESTRTPGELSNDPTHAADHDAEDVRKEVTVEETLTEELRAVNAAMERISDGTYGYCEQCGREIGRERLEAIPHTTRCVECERQEENA